MSGGGLSHQYLTYFVANMLCSIEGSRYARLVLFMSLNLLPQRNFTAIVEVELSKLFDGGLARFEACVKGALGLLQ